MRLAFLALTACLLTAPAFAQDAIKFPEKLDARAAGYQMAYSDAGPVYVAGLDWFLGIAGYFSVDRKKGFGFHQCAKSLFALEPPGEF